MQATAFEHFNAGRFAEAEALCRSILQRAPDDFWTLRVLASVYLKQAAWDRARPVLQAAWAVGAPDDEAAVFLMDNLAMLHIIANEFNEGLQWAQAALARKPDDMVAHMHNANALLGLNRPVEALLQYRTARSIEPDDAQLEVNEGLILIAMGDWKAGWAQCERRRVMPPGFDEEAFADVLPRWRGETDIRGKTLWVQAEQGLGDTLQFVRFMPLLAERGARIVLRVQPSLGKLLADYPGVDRLITFHDEPGDVDLYCMLMSLPAILGITLDNLPAPVPYLHASPEYRMIWQALLGPRKRRPRIGIAWSGGQQLPLRSMPLATLQPLLARQEFEFHVLQKDILEADRNWLAAHPELIDHSAELQDFSDTAALVSLMDLVVTIDTSIAHLAGALARPTWIMLPLNADAKWLLDRSDSPWYPTARLFRQKRLRDWTTVVAEVLRALASPTIEPHAAPPYPPYDTEE